MKLRINESPEIRGGFSDEYIAKKFDKYVTSAKSEAELFQNAFGDEWEKPYMVFTLRDGTYSWETHSLIPAQDFIAAVQKVQNTYGKIYNMKQQGRWGDIVFYDKDNNVIGRYDTAKRALIESASNKNTTTTKLLSKLDESVLVSGDIEILIDNTNLTNKEDIIDRVEAIILNGEENKDREDIDITSIKIVGVEETLLKGYGAANPKYKPYGGIPTYVVSAKVTGTLTYINGDTENWEDKDIKFRVKKNISTK